MSVVSCSNHLFGHESSKASMSLNCILPLHAVLLRRWYVNHLYRACAVHGGHFSTSCSTSCQVVQNKSLCKYFCARSPDPDGEECFEMRVSVCCSCIRKFGNSTQDLWLWMDVLTDLLFLQDLCVLLLSAYYTDRTANVVLVASQTASVEAGQHEQTSAGQHNARRMSSKLSLAQTAEPASMASRNLARSMSRTKRDVSYMPNAIGALNLVRQCPSRAMCGTCC